MSSPSRSKAKVVAAFVGVFVFGGVTGGAIGRYVDARRSIDVFDAAGEGSRHGVLLWSLQRKLSLSGDQETKIKAIFARYDSDVAGLPVDPRAATLKQTMRADIRATLDPGQRTKYDELMKGLDAKRRRPEPAAASDSTLPAPSSSSP